MILTGRQRMTLGLKNVAALPLVKEIKSDRLRELARMDESERRQLVKMPALKFLSNRFGWEISR